MFQSEALYPGQDGIGAMSFQAGVRWETTSCVPGKLEIGKGRGRAPDGGMLYLTKRQGALDDFLF